MKRSTIMLLTTLILSSCGVKVKHEVSGTIAVAVPTNYTIGGTVNGVFTVPADSFEVSCTQKYQDVASAVDRNTQIDNCIAQKQAITQQLINSLNGIPTPTTTP